MKNQGFLTTERNRKDEGSGRGSVGKAVASDTIGLQFESSHRQTLYYLFTVNCVEKTKIKQKRGRDRPNF